MFLELIKSQKYTDTITLENALHVAMWIEKEFPQVTVYIHGSVLRPELVHPGSDIDIVIKGLSDRDYSTLIKATLKRFSFLKVDIRRYEELDAYMRQKIEDKGCRVKNEKDVRSAQK
jgi:predicted nucleotidyltransferase